MAMKRTITLVGAWLLLVLVVFTAGASAQGVQTGSIRGIVKDQQELPVPGVTVTATSASLQGPRTAVTNNIGLYTLTALPAGDYEVKFELSGFDSITRSTAVPLGLTIDQNVSLRAAGVSQSVQVVAESPAPIATPIVGANFKHEEIEALATPRTIQGIAQLSPAVTENSPNAGQIVINGAFAFDSVFMVNGVDINDNLFAQPQNLFIEDAIEETQVLTSGISAEYGRFTGGVINAITKSGGNKFTGSGRVNFSNPSWTTASPFEVAKNSAATAHPDIVSRTYEGTFGGPIAKDRLWFFTSGRYGSVNSTTTLQQSGVALPTNDLNKRGELKLTGTVVQNHTIQGGFLTDPRTRTNNSGLQSFVISPDSEVTRSNPNWYYYTNYRGVLKNNMLVEAQFSQRHFKFEGDGGTSTNLVNSPILSATQCACVYNAPYFDATDPEERNNKQITGSVTNFWNKGGGHEIKAGYEFFRSQRTGGNSQSSSSYVFNSDFATDASGAPLLDSNGHVVPMFVPGVSSVDFYPAVKGAIMNTDNNSLYVQDHWTINSRWSTDLGARYEHVRAASTGDIISVNNNRIVPRLAVAFDPKGNGNHVFHVTYGWYSGRYDEAQIGANSPVGNPADLNTVYSGPAGQGVGFAPGFTIKNYPVDANASATVPLANVFTDPNLKSPVVREFTTSYGESLFSGKGYAEATYIHRRTVDLIEDFQTIAGGFTDVKLQGVDAGLFTNIYYKNSDLARRVYDAMVFQSRYRLSNRWSINGHYTLMLRNDGNYEGEATSQPGKTSFIGNYPEAFNATRNFPDGRLQDFQRSRLRIWSVYDLPLGRLGDVSLSGLWRVDSGLTYSVRAASQPLTATQSAILANAGYPDAPTTTSSSSGYYVYFAPRGTGNFAGFGLLDTSINYKIPVFRTLSPWLKFDVYNLFDNEKLIAWSTSLKQDPNSPKDNLGLATGYLPSNAKTYGTATGNTINLVGFTVNAFPLAYNGALPGGRTIRVSTGIRF
jgi:outer membrane receptor protein involved in Fe transport